MPDLSQLSFASMSRYPLRTLLNSLLSTLLSSLFSTIAPVFILHLLLCPEARAGRPLITDDASTAEVGQCQIETWAEQGTDFYPARIIAPACGIASGLEFDLGYSWPTPRDSISMALKWVPSAAQFETDIGKFSFGSKLTAGFLRPDESSKRELATNLLLLGTWEINPNLSMHGNFGPQYDKASRNSTTLLNLAMVWKAHPKLQLFAEVLANDRPEQFGNTLRSVGARWWLINDKLGLDISAIRMNGYRQTLWTAGLGWYGIEW